MASLKLMKLEHFLELKYLSLNFNRIAEQVRDVCSKPFPEIYVKSYDQALLSILHEEIEDKFNMFKHLEAEILEESGVSEKEIKHLTELTNAIRIAHLYISVQIELRSQRKREETSSDSKCFFCESKVHYISCCLGFENMSVRRRRRFLLGNKLCFKCLGSHDDQICTKEVSCQVCGRDNHHTLVHIE